MNSQSDHTLLGQRSLNLPWEILPVEPSVKVGIRPNSVYPDGHIYEIPDRKMLNTFAAFLDESGTNWDPENAPFRVTAGIIVELTTTAYALEVNANDLFNALVPCQYRDGFVFHATELFNSNNIYDEDIFPWRERQNLVREMLRILQHHKVPIAFGIVTAGWSSTAFPFGEKLFETANGVIRQDATKRSKAREAIVSIEHEVSFGLCVERIDCFVESYCPSKEPIPLVAEHHPTMEDKLKNHILWRKANPFTDVNNARLSVLNQVKNEKPTVRAFDLRYIASPPEFVPKNCIFTQFADACAYSFRRALNQKGQGEQLLIQMMQPREAAMFCSEDANFEGINGGLVNHSSFATSETTNIVTEIEQEQMFDRARKSGRIRRDGKIR